jgi:hypothetical protein
MSEEPPTAVHEERRVATMRLYTDAELAFRTIARLRSALEWVRDQLDELPDNDDEWVLAERLMVILSHIDQALEK